MSNKSAWEGAEFDVPATKKPKKGILKPSPVIEEDEPARASDDEEDEVEDVEGEDEDDEVEDEPDVIEIDGEEGGDDEDEDEEESASGKKKKPTKRSPKKFVETEKEADFVKVQIYDAAGKELATRLGLIGKGGWGFPTQKMKLVVKKIKRTVTDADIHYGGNIEVRVDANGNVIAKKDLITKKIDPNKMKDAGDPEQKVTRGLSHYSPARPNAPRVNTFNDKFQFGKSVKFTLRVHAGEDYQIRGIVVNFDDTRAEVVPVAYPAGFPPGQRSESFWVDYGKLRSGQKPAKKVGIKPAALVPIESMYNQPVPGALRAMVVNLYIASLRALFAAAEEVKAPKLDDPVVAAQIQDPSLEPMEWARYYAIEFRKWVMSVHNDFIIDAGDARVLEEARKMMAEDTDKHRMIAAISSAVSGGLTVDTTVAEIRNALRDKRDLTAIQARVLQRFEAEGSAGNQEVKGKALARMLEEEINKFFLQFPPDINKYVSVIGEAIRRQRVANYIPTDEERLEFDITYLDDLQTEYQKYAADTAAKKAEAEKRGAK